MKINMALFGKKKQDLFPNPIDNPTAQTIPVVQPSQQVVRKRLPDKNADFELQSSQIKRAIQPTEVPKEKTEPKAEGRIIVAEFLEGGLFRSVILSNKSLGEVGTTFDLEED
jgi:hypothetical protein